MFRINAESGDFPCIRQSGRCRLRTCRSGTDRLSVGYGLLYVARWAPTVLDVGGLRQVGGEVADHRCWDGAPERLLVVVARGKLQRQPVLIHRVATRLAVPERAHQIRRQHTGQAVYLAQLALEPTIDCELSLTGVATTYAHQLAWCSQSHACA